MENRQSKGLCYNCDEKYVKGHHYREKKLFHMDVGSPFMVDEVSHKEPSKDEETD